MTNNIQDDNNDKKVADVDSDLSRKNAQMNAEEEEKKKKEKKDKDDKRNNSDDEDDKK